MAINLLNGPMNVPGKAGMSTPTGNQYVPIAKTPTPPPPQPLGVTAKTPSVSTPPTTLPKTQQNPVVTPAPVDKPPTSQGSTDPRFTGVPAGPYQGVDGNTYGNSAGASMPTPNTYSGLLGQAVNTAMQGSPQASQYAQQAAQYGANAGGIGNQALGIGDYYQKQIQGLLPSYGNAIGEETTGTQPVAAGNSTIAFNAISNRLNNLQNAETAALAPYNQALTGQQQAAQAAQAASGVPLSQYGTQVGALQSAYESAKPQLGSPYQIPFSPINQGQGAPLGSTAPGGLNALAQNYGTFEGIQQGAQSAAAAPGQTQAQNIQTAGTATPTAYNSIYQNALNDYTNLQQSVQNVDQFGNLLTSNMVAGGINPTDVKYANATLAQIRGQLSSGAQAQYDTTLAALRSKVSGMLSIGGSETPTAITADAQKILDGSLPLSSLNDVLSRIQTEGNILLQSQAGKVNTAKSGTQAPNTQPTQSTTTGAQGWL